MLPDKGLMLSLALFWGMVMVPTTPFWMLLPPPQFRRVTGCSGVGDDQLPWASLV